MRILLVEDEIYMAQAVAQVLEKNNYTVDLAHDGEYGLDCALSGIYDMIILDIMLPGRSGLEIFKHPPPGKDRSSHSAADSQERNRGQSNGPGLRSRRIT